MSAEAWVNEIVKYRGHLWTVAEWHNNGIHRDEDGAVWLRLVDHYGSGAECTAWAEDVEVALQ